ncbi:MAG TPA: choice-of-anchor Q domain-containing protein [Bryobacteraceae bacterium]
MTLTVTNTNDAGAGSLRLSIAAAANGDTIIFGVPPGSTITLTSGELAIATGLTIQGPGAKLLTISGNANSRIFNVTATNPVSISGLTLVNGKPVGGINGGGAILLNGGAGAPSYTLTGLNITNNDVTLAGNPLGGGIDNEGGTVTITGSTISNNTATFRGGGIQNQGFGSMTITNSTIAGNTAGVAGIGGGIRTLVNLTLSSVTVFGNSANAGGNVSVSAATTNLQNTIIAGGSLLGGGVTSPDLGGTVNSQDYNLIQNVSGANVNGTTTHNITGVDPLLAPLADRGGSTPTMAENTGSPGVDKGLSAGLTTDQRGLPRPVDLGTIANAAGGDGADIGAFEAQSVVELQVAATPTLSEFGLFLFALMLASMAALMLKPRLS